MLPFENLIVIDRESAVPVYQQIANRIVALIQQGLLPPGTALPGSRRLAELLQLHRKTVIAAYDELLGQDWIVSMPRKGMIVATNLPVVKPRSFKDGPGAGQYGRSSGFRLTDLSLPGTIPLPRQHVLAINDGFPDVRFSPLELLLRECKSIVSRRNHYRSLMYSPSEGSPNLRQALADFLADTRGLYIGPEHLLITRGAQMSIYLAAATILRPGDCVIAGDPSYFIADDCFRQLGARILRVPVDADGMDVDAVEQLCRTKKIRMLYVVPHHHHPTTVTLSAERRMKLLALIHKYRLAVIEDDYDYDFHYDSSPILPLASADHGGNVIYIGSLTKALGLSVRMGFMVAPSDFVVHAAGMRRNIDLRGDVLMEEALATLFRNGDVSRHLKKSVKVYHERRDLFCRLLRDELGHALSFGVPSGGMAVWTTFHRKYPLKKVAARASERGMFMSDGVLYDSETKALNSLRMGFASLSEKEMEQVVEILVAVTRSVGPR